MTVEQLAEFLEWHPDWSPFYRSHPVSPVDWQPWLCGLVAPSGQFYRVEAVSKALETRRSG